MKLPFAILTLAVAPIGIVLGANQLLLRDLDIGDQGTASVLAANSAGNLFAVSTFKDTSGVVQVRVIKTDPNGSPLASFDFPGYSAASAMTDAQGNLVIVGSTESNFPLVNPLFPALTGGGAYILKLDSQLKGILFSTVLNATSTVNAVALDSTGDIYVTGTTSAPDFPVTANAYQSRAPNSKTYYAFLTELSPNGDKLLYSTYFGGDATPCYTDGSSCQGIAAATEGLAVAVGSSGAVVISGETTASDLPVTAGAVNAGCFCTNLTRNGFLAEFPSSNLQELSWSTYINLAGTTSTPVLADKFIDAVAIDPAGDVIIGGKAAFGLATTPGVLQAALTSTDGSGGLLAGGFLAKVTASGTKLAWMTWFGGSPPDGSQEIGILSHVAGLALDPQGGIVVTGFSQTSQLPPLPGAIVLGQSYVARVTGDGTSLVELFAGPMGSAGAGLALATSGSFRSLGPPGTVWVETAASGPSLLATANAASGPVSGLVAPAEIVSLYGLGIGPPAAVQGQIKGGVYAASLEGYQVLFDGVPAPLLWLGPTQVNAVVPQALSGDYTHIELVTPAGTVDGPTLAVREAAPYVFSYNLATPLVDGTNSLAAALNQDGTINSPQNPAKAGQIVTIFVSGGGDDFGPFMPDGTVVDSSNFHNSLLPVAVLSDPLGSAPGTSLAVLYAGEAPQMVLGVMQINFQLPEIFPPPSFETFRFALQVAGMPGGVASVAISE